MYRTLFSNILASSHVTYRYVMTDFSELVTGVKVFCVQNSDASATAFVIINLSSQDYSVSFTGSLPSSLLFLHLPPSSLQLPLTFPLLIQKGTGTDEKHRGEWHFEGKNGEIDTYALTLNGNPLIFSKGGLPDLSTLGMKTDPATPVKVSPHSISFIAYHA
jgi:hypothetical protein